MIAQLSEVTPWLVASSKTASEDEADTVEKLGPVIAAVLQPSRFLVTAQVVIVGGVLSTTLTTCVQTTGSQPEQVSVLSMVYEPQVVPEVTVTVADVVEPEIDAPLVLLIMAQL